MGAVVILTPTFFPLMGGAEIGIHEIADRLGETRPVIVMTPYREGLQEESCHMKHYEVVRYKNKFYDSSHRALRIISFLCIPEMVALHRLRKRCEIDVVNIHFLRPFGFLAVYNRLFFATHVVVSLVGRTDVLMRLSKPRRLMARFCLSSADEVVQISAYCTRGYPSIRRIETIPYGTDIEKFDPSRRSERLRLTMGVSKDRYLALTVSRLVYSKRVDVLIEVMKCLADDACPVTLVIVGAGPEEQRLRLRARDLHLDNVLFAGFMPASQLPILYASADLFLTHSLDETFGVMFAEAMASALPIVAAETSCIPDVVRDHVDGYLVPPFDVRFFSAKIAELVADEDTRRAIGRVARRRALQEFDWNLISRQYEAVYARSSHPS
jgi:glycosyltransferase involved in cell wall biosynthesis